MYRVSGPHSALARQGLRAALAKLWTEASSLYISTLDVKEKQPERDIWFLGERHWKLVQIGDESRGKSPSYRWED